MEIKMDKMKYVILIVLFSSVLTFRATGREIADTISIQQSNTVSLPDSIEELLNNNLAKIDSLANANTVLKGLLRDSQKETESKDRVISNLQHKINELQNITIKSLEASNDTLQRRLISMASNFLYIPYDEYSIQEIALPAFMSTKGTSAFTRYQNRLPLLQNYKSDIESLVNSLSQMEKDLSIQFMPMINQKAKEHQDNLSSSTLYLRYVSYDDWENTYLGNQIRIIQSLLKSPSKETSSELKNLRLKLERLLKND